MSRNAILRSDVWRGTLAGTLLVLLGKIPWSSLAQTIVLAAVGAASSFIVSSLLRYLTRKRRQKPPPRP